MIAFDYNCTLKFFKKYMKISQHNYDNNIYFNLQKQNFRRRLYL